ncbi:MAG: multidrug efflux MFS transporter [Labilibaculum sp.]|nr:multidrug efflux MFS transporter [Labilibaculum sp.]
MINTSETTALEAKTLPQEGKQEFTPKQRILIMLPLLIGGFIAMLNETILNVAFPQLMLALDVSLGTVQWLGTAYLLVIGILVPITAFFIKTFPTKKLYIFAMLLFTIGTVLCGISPNFSFLLVSRILQGAGTGMLLPIMMDTIMLIFPPSKRGAAIGISMMVVVSAPVLGPTLSGFILQYFSWQWLFFTMLPFAVIAVITGAMFLKSFSELTKPKIDIPSILLSTIGFGGLIFGISSFETLGLGNPVVFVSLLCGIAGLLVFSKRQLALKQPMLELRIFRYPMFTLGTVLLFITFMMPFAVQIILPTYMQNVLGVNAINTGLALLLGGILSIVVIPVSGRLFDRIGAKPPVIVGFVALTVTMFFLSRISEATVLAALIVFQSLMNVGVSLIITPAQTNSLNQLPEKDMVHGVAILNTIQQVAAAFGSALFIGLMSATYEKNLHHIASPSVAQQHLATINGANAAFSVALVIVAIGLLLSFFIKRRKYQTVSIPQ